MIVRSLFIAIFACLLTFPAMAGTVNVTDGQGTWVSTKCQTPPTPEALSRDAEAPANDLNAQMHIHNKYVAMAQDYMACLSQEAEADAQAANQIITRSAQNMIQAIQTQVTQSADRFKK